MRKIISILLVCLVALVFSGVAFAGPFDRETAREVGYVNVASTSADAALIAQPCFIYAVTLRPSTAAGDVSIYDNASAASGTVIIEIEEATQYDSRREVFDPPVKASNGVYVDLTTAGVTVEYR